MALQIRRGTDAERLLITPLQGELIYTTDSKKLYVGDGTTVGGIAVDTGTGGGGGASLLDELTDVTITSPTNGQVLKYNGTSWTNGTDLTGSGGGASLLDELTDVTITSPTNGQVLKYNGTAWVNDTDLTGGGGGASLLDELTDVILNSPSLGQVLTYNGTSWVNDDILITTANINDFTITGPVASEVLRHDGVRWTNERLQLNDLGDALIGTVGPGQVLTHNGSFWVNAPVEIINDTTPTLGGDLLLNNNDISGTGNINITGDITATNATFSTLVAPANTLTFTGVTTGQRSTIRIRSQDERGILKLTRRSDSDLSAVDTSYGSVQFERFDSSGLFTTTGTITGSRTSILIGADPTGAFGETRYVTTKYSADGATFGIRTWTPAEALDVRGNAVVSGFVQFGSYTTTARDALTPAFGMVIYNTTTNTFQGYQNTGGTTPEWVNLS